MRFTRFLAATGLVAFALISAGCENTADGLREDTQENVSELNDEINEDG